jgi:hydroxymethylpyrimidine/phosphomethylpyrimidine kinase
MTPIALTIAGSDPSGGAGIQADLKTFHQRNVYGMSVLTLLTVQNTRSVDAVEPLAPGFVLAQLDSVLEDIPPHAAKLARSVPAKSSRRSLGARPTFLFLW